MKCSCTKLVLAAMSAIALLACSKSDLEPSPGGSGDDRVSPVIQAGIGGANTRAHDAVWDENDAIGLAMLDNDGEGVINEVYNYHYITSENLGVFEPHSSAMMIYFPSDGSLVSFRAYYPYYSRLDEHMIVPVNVSSQAELPDIDFMSADHITGRSKYEPVVRLHFHHRLTKLIFKLTGENQEVFGNLADCVITVRGMKTAGKYDLLTERLEVDGESGRDITFMRHDSPAGERYGIVLPRESGAGVEFDFSFPNGSKYTAKMSSDLDLLPGYQYTFYINLTETPAEVSADIEDWIDGPERTYDAFQTTVEAGESVNVDPGTEMEVFITGDPNEDYSQLAPFTYNDKGKWIPDEDVYWESIPYDPAYMRSSIVMAEPLNNTQAGDWLVSEPVTVGRNTGAKFVLSRAVSKLFVELRSDQFEATELADAVVTMPDFLTGGYLELGEFVPGTTRADILMADDAETGDRVAIFQPQTMSAGGNVLSIDLNGRTYYVETEAGGYDFEAGIAYKFIVRLNKVGLSISVTIMDWEPGPVENLDAVQLGTVAGASHNVTVGDRIDLYLLEGTEYEYKSTYTYKSDLTWEGSPTIYWEDLPVGTAYFQARMDVADALNSTQLPDVLLSPEPERGYHNTGLDLELSHAAAKAVVSLVSTTFSDEQLAAATITLPSYVTGGRFEGVELISGGSNKGTINVVRTGQFTGEAIFEPQVIAEGADAVSVTIGGNTFTAPATADIDFAAGYATTLVVKVEKNGISLSVTVNDWQEGGTVNLEVLKIEADAGATNGVQPGEQMTIYTGEQRTELGTFTYTGTAWDGPTIYWEDLDDPTRFYASIERQAAYNNTMPDDILLTEPVTAGYGEPLRFTLSHAVAQVAVQLKSSDGVYTDAQLAAMTVTLPDYLTGGSYDNGVFVPGQETNVPVQLSTGSSALAFVQPQTIRAGRTVANVSANGRDYPVTYGSDIVYTAGYTTLLVIDINKSEIAISARVIDWKPGQDIELVARSIEVTGNLEGTDKEFFTGKTIYLYDTDGSEAYPYTYMDSAWSGEKLYWDDYVTTGLNLAAVYYPSAIQPKPAGTTSFPVNISDDQSTGWDRWDLLMDYIPYAPGVFRNYNFNFKHVLSQVQVVLVSDEFTDADFQGATVELNNVILDGTASLAAAAVTAGNTRVNSVTPQRDNANGREYSALVQPGQQIPTTLDVVTVTLPGYPGDSFTGRLTTAVTLQAGTVTVITVELRRTEIKLSARVESWGDNGGGSVIIQ